jgi:uracil-DNA glycosylase family 4
MFTLKSMCAARGVHFVEGRGNKSAPIWLIQEGPSDNDLAERLTLSGGAGWLLDTMLGEAGLVAGRDVYITNVYKTKAPGGDPVALKNLGATHQEHIDALLEEINAANPAVVVAMGAGPFGLLCPKSVNKRDGDFKISQWRGSLLVSPSIHCPHYVIPTYPPSFVLANWSERQMFIHCLAKAKEESDYKTYHGMMKPLPERQLIVEPSYDTVYGYLYDIIRSPNPVSVDIETIRRSMPYILSLAQSAKSGISFSYWDYTNSQCVQIWRMLDHIFRFKKQIGQNYLSFDATQHETLGFRTNPMLVEDTMVRHHVLWPELEHKLQFQTFQYTREPYYKDEGHEWRPGTPIRFYQVYNAKDTTVTYEIWDEQNKEFEDRPTLRAFYDRIVRKRYSHMFNVERRGLSVDEAKLAEFKKYIVEQLNASCDRVTQIIGKKTVFNGEEATLAKKGNKGLEVFNIASPMQVVQELKNVGLKVPKDRRTGKETTGEAGLQRLLAATGHQVLREVLQTRELNKIKGTYVNVQLAGGNIYCNYVVTGTVTGRCSSRGNIFGIGTNLQNLPKHSDLGLRFRECLVARPGKIFVSGDQSTAEDWIVQGIIADVSGCHRGLDELKSGADRHAKLASFIFQKPESECNKKSMERYLGKKIRHASNYDMKGYTFSEALAKDGFIMPQSHCDVLLEKFHTFDPTIKDIYHEWVKKTLNETRTLRTPFGRERIFLGLRSRSDNEATYREGYSYIPQSTVGDNNGLAMIYVEEHAPELAVMDTHDSIDLEVDDNPQAILAAIQLLHEAYNRQIHLPNGLVIQIPCEVELGYNQRDMTKCPDNLSEGGLMSILAGLQRPAKVLTTTTCGQQ